MNYFCRFT